MQHVCPGLECCLMLQKTLKPDSSPTYEQPIPGLSDIKFKSANAVGWHPTGFEHALASKEQCWVQTCAYLSL